MALLLSSRLWRSRLQLKLSIGLFICFSIGLGAQDWQLTQVGQLPEAVANNAVCEGFVGDTTYIYSFAGIDSTKSHAGIHLRSYRYNTLTHEVQQIADLPDNLGKIAAAASRVKDTIYIIGGYHVFSSGTEVSSARVHRYSVQQDSFLDNGADIPVPIDDQVQAVWRDSLIYVVTGWSNSTNVPNVQIYNPTTNVWSAGTAVPNNNAYKSFGASGAIIGDTIYYFGGASLSGAFNIQNQLRKGVINPDNPTEITWSVQVPDSDVRGYRMGATTLSDKVCWIGGSEQTYNFDGIAYNGSGGVPPANRSLYWSVNDSDGWQQSLTNELPMDLRGVGEYSDSIKYLIGGMEAEQRVSNKILRLEWVQTTAANEAVALQSLELFPNPIASNTLYVKADKVGAGTLNVQVFNLLGQLELAYKKQSSATLTIDVSSLDRGQYVLIVSSGQGQYLNRFIRL